MCKFKRYYNDNICSYNPCLLGTWLKWHYMNQFINRHLKILYLLLIISAAIIFSNQVSFAGGLRPGIIIPTTTTTQPAPISISASLDGPYYVNSKVNIKWAATSGKALTAYCMWWDSKPSVWKASVMIIPTASRTLKVSLWPKATPTYRWALTTSAGVTNTSISSKLSEGKHKWYIHIWDQRKYPDPASLLYLIALSTNQSSGSKTSVGVEFFVDRTPPNAPLITFPNAVKAKGSTKHIYYASSSKGKMEVIVTPQGDVGTVQSGIAHTVARIISYIEGKKQYWNPNSNVWQSNRYDFVDTTTYNWPAYVGETDQGLKKVMLHGLRHGQRVYVEAYSKDRSKNMSTITGQVDRRGPKSMFEYYDPSPPKSTAPMVQSQTDEDNNPQIMLFRNYLEYGEEL
jgi:hypothetical protein